MIEHLKKIRYILGDQFRHIFFLSFLFLLSSFTELFSIGLIGPFIALALTPEQLSGYPLWFTVSDLFGIESFADGIIILGLSLTIIFIVKSIFSYYVFKRIVTFTYGHQRKVRAYLLYRYQQMSFEKILNKNSASMINVTNNHIAIFTNSLVAILRMLSDLVVLIALVLLLLYVNFYVTLVLIFLFFLVALIYNFAWKSAVETAGDEVAIANKSIIKSVNQAILGFKQIRVYRKEHYFLKKLFNATNRYSSAAKNATQLQIIPRYFIECLLVVFVIGLTLVALSSGEDAQYLLVTLSVFGVAALRMMPSFLVVIAGFTTLYNTKYLVSEIHEDLSLDNPEKIISYDEFSISKDPMSDFHSFKDKIEIKDISFTYQAMEKPAIDKVSLNIEKSSSIGIIGTSGAGKTTFVDLILGLYKPQNGDILVDGISIFENPLAWMNNVAYIPQDAFLTDDSVEKNIALGIPDNDIDQDKLKDALKKAQLSKFIAELPDGIKTNIGERGARISGGQKQRIALARALYFDRQVIIMDEATAAIDSETEKEIVKAIKFLSGKVTLLIIAHRLTTIESCDLICRLDNGKLIESGTYNEIVKRETQ